MGMADSLLGDSKKVRALIIIFVLIIIPIALRQITLTQLENAPTLCIYKNITGRDCWGCGTSRAIVSILNFEFKQAYEFNKGILVVFPLLVYLWFKRLIINIKVIFSTNKLP